MKSMLKTTLMGLTALSLVACASGPKLAQTGVYKVGSYSVPLQQDWTAFNLKTGKGKKAHLLTVDGTTLNSVFLYNDLKEGDSLMKARKKDTPVPTFTPDLSELELVEFLSDSLERGQGLIDVTPTNIEPSSFQGEDAVQFDFSAVTPDGLKVSGQSLLGVVDEKLNILIYMAPSIHYFEKLEDDVSVMIKALSAS